MAKEIQVASGFTTGSMWAIMRSAVGTVVKTSDGSLVAYVTANLANYTITMTQQGTASGFWTGDVPAGVAAGVYSVVVYRQAGGSPVESDCSTIVACGDIQWDGTTTGFGTLDAAGVRAAVGLVAANLDTQLAEIEAETDGIASIPTAAQNAAALLKYDQSTITGEALYSPINALRKLRDWTISGNTLSVFKEDAVTPAYTQTLTATAGVSPITSITG